MGPIKWCAFLKVLSARTRYLGEHSEGERKIWMVFKVAKLFYDCSRDTINIEVGGGKNET